MYRAFMVAFLEGICLDPSTAKCRRLLAVLKQLFTRLERWEGIVGSYHSLVRKGYCCIKVAAHAFFNAQPSLLHA